MAETVTDAQVRKLGARFGAGLGIGNYLRQYWAAEGFSSPPVGKAELDHYRSRGAVGATIGDVRYDYWARKGFQYDTGPVGNTDSGDGPVPSGGVVAFWKAKSYSGAGELLDLTGKGRNLQLGTAAGADTNDPLWLPFTGEKYVSLPGIVGNWASTPDTADLRIVGDIDIRAKVSLDNWGNTGTYRALVGKYNASSNHIGYLFCVGPTGGLSFLWSPTGAGAAQRIIHSNELLGYASNTVKWVRVAVDIDNGAAGVTTNFFTSDDGVTWTPLGTPVVSAGASSLFAGLSPLELGTSGTGGSLWAGSVRRAEVRNGINGAVVANFDASTAVEPFATTTDSTGRVWTFSRTAAGRKLAVVDRSLFLLGADDSFQAVDHADLNFGAVDNFTLLIAVRGYGMPASGRFMDKRVVGVGGYIIYSGGGMTATSNVGDAATGVVDTGPDMVSGRIGMMALRVTRPIMDLLVNGVSNGTMSIAAVGSMVNTSLFWIGRHTGANYGDFEFIAAAVVRRALSNSELAAITAELLA